MSQISGLSLLSVASDSEMLWFISSNVAISYFQEEVQAVFV